MYKRESTQYDIDYVKYDEDPNAILIFVRCSPPLFSIISPVPVGWSVPRRQLRLRHRCPFKPPTRPDEQSAALLRAILLTLNQSAISGEPPIVPPVRERLSSEIATVTCLMCASLTISMLAASIAMLSKQWLNRYLRNLDRSTVERCGDRNVTAMDSRDGHYIPPPSPPVMLQVALLLLACGLCRYLWFINSVAFTLIRLTGLGVASYVAIVIVGISSYACPFQTPTSAAPRGLRKKVRRGIISLTPHCKRVLSWSHWMWNHEVQSFLHCQSLPTTIPLENLGAHQSEPWMVPRDLSIIRRTNAGGV